MPVSADLPALRPGRLAVPLLIALLATASAGAAESAPKPRPKPATAAAAARTAPAAADATSALTARGERLEGEAKFSAGAISLGAASVAVDALVALELPGARARWFDQGVVLVDGQLLRGSPRSLQQDKLDFACDLIGPRSLPITSVAAVILANAPVDETLAGLDGFAGAVLGNGDRIAGTLSFINEKDVGIDTGRKIAQIPRARVKVLSLRAAAPAAGLWLRTASGDRLRGALGGDGFTTAGPALGEGEPFRIPLSALRSAWSEGPGLAPLERRKPTIALAPQFDEDLPVTVGRFRDGSPLELAGRRIDRGIACHSGCELAWSDLAGFSTLVGEVGVAAGPGVAACRVVVDGKTAFDSGPLAGGAAPRSFAVPLGGAKEVRLIADAGPDGDTAGDRVVWAWPTLVK